MRSLLFVPVKEKLLKKVGLLGADAYILDLEDSIIDEEKKAALQLLKVFLMSVDKNIKIIVRVNKNNYVKEINELKNFEVSFMLPKFETFDEYSDIPLEKKYIALIETPRGVLNCKEIVMCKYIDSIAFGAEDFTASIGMDNDILLLQPQKNMLVTCAKAYGKKVFDTPSFKLDNFEEFTKEVDNARALGFDGKMAINPRQIDTINNLFSITDYNYILNVIETYEQCGDAVQVIDGKVFEKMHISHLKKILKENKGE